MKRNLNKVKPVVKDTGFDDEELSRALQLSLIVERETRELEEAINLSRALELSEQEEIRRKEKVKEESKRIAGSGINEVQLPRQETETETERVPQVLPADGNNLENFDIPSSPSNPDSSNEISSAEPIITEAFPLALAHEVKPVKRSILQRLANLTLHRKKNKFKDAVVEATTVVEYHEL